MGTVLFELSTSTHALSVCRHCYEVIVSVFSSKLCGILENILVWETQSVHDCC